jgi:hypothetical protein
MDSSAERTLLPARPLLRNGPSPSRRTRLEHVARRLSQHAANPIGPGTPSWKVDRADRRPTSLWVWAARALLTPARLPDVVAALCAGKVLSPRAWPRAFQVMLLLVKQDSMDEVGVLADFAPWRSARWTNPTPLFHLCSVFRGPQRCALRSDRPTQRKPLPKITSVCRTDAREQVLSHSSAPFRAPRRSARSMALGDDPLCFPGREPLSPPVRCG